MLRRTAANHGIDLITGIHGNVMLAILGRVQDQARIARLLTAHFGPGPVIASEPLRNLDEVPDAARTTMRALTVASAWPAAPRPVVTTDLLPERALAGDLDAQAELVASVFTPLAAESALLETASTFLESSPSLEATARTLFIHANTVRYRLRQITELTGYSPLDPRDAFALRLGLTYGRIHQSNS